MGARTDFPGPDDFDTGWKLWGDMVRYYPSAVHRRRRVVAWLGPLRPRAILDVGCGPGHLLDDLHERFPGASFCGVDKAVQTIEENRRRLPWCRFEVLDIAEAHLTMHFDVVICSEVLEHVSDDGAALRNLSAMTQRTLILTVPAGRLYPLEARFGHLRHYALEPLCRSVAAQGLTVQRAEAWGFPFMTLLKWAANLRPEATMATFAAGEWSRPKRTFGGLLTLLFHLNVTGRGPQLFVLATR